MRHYNLKKISLVALFFALALMLSVQFVSGQGPVKPAAKYEEKSARINGIDLHYLDFGGKGVPLIFLQSFHGDAKEWVDYDFVGLAPSFANTNRVLAITRRGWGKSKEDEVRNLDPATNGEDIVALMNSLGLQKAVFLGRIPGNMDMTWLAEHHPERVAGLIYVGLPDSPLRETADPDVIKLDNAFSTMACDLGPDSHRKTRMRVNYVPHFIDDPARRMTTPAILIEPAGMAEGPGRHLMWFGGILAEAAKDPKFKVCDAGATEYFLALAKDPERQKKLRADLIALNRSKEFRDGFKRAFGTSLKLATFPNQPENVTYEEYWRDTLLAFFVAEISAYLSKIK